MNESALAGVRVLDLAGEMGAHCGKLLADMGAEVIKIEPPEGDRLRRVGPFRERPDADRSLAFWHYNANKRSVVLELDRASDRARFLHLARGADVVLETFAPGTLARWSLSYPELRRDNPGLVLASLSAFGQTGPYRSWKTSDLVAQALGGMLFVNGDPGERPLRSLGPQAYHCGSVIAAIGILLALLWRARTGRGQWLDLSLQEAVAASLEHVSGSYFQDGLIQERSGSMHWTRLFRVGRCKDGFVLLSGAGDWTSLLEWLKADAAAADLIAPEWSHVEHRRAHAEHLFDVLDSWARRYTVGDLISAAQPRRLPFAPVVALRSVPADEQLHARRFFADLYHQDLGVTVRYPGAPAVFSGTPWKLRLRPPCLGEHTAAVFAESEGWDVARPSRHSRPEPDGGARRALDGVRVVDFTWVVAGPVATRILCDQGAEVIKIERPDAADLETRRGGIRGNLNRGKQSIILDMNEPRGLDLARALIAHADVVIDNFSTRVLPNWGLDYENLRRINPRIIALSMSGFGHGGPRKDHVSYGPTLQALAGYTDSMRHEHGEPVGWGYSYSDIAAGHQAALSILLALFHRRRTGRGQCIDLSQFENLVSLVGPDLLVALAGTEGPPTPALVPAFAPEGVYRCADAPAAAGVRRRNDRWCAVTVDGEAEWDRFRAATGHPTWCDDPRFATAESRAAHRAALDAHITKWTGTRPAEEVMRTLQAAGIAAGVVADAEDLCRRDPHLRARGYWAEVATPEGELVRLDGPAVRLPDAPAGIERPAPLPGEHTDEVLRRLLGLSPERIDELFRDGIVGAVRPGRDDSRPSRDA